MDEQANRETRCHACGTPLRAYAVYCTNCGAARHTPNAAGLAPDVPSTVGNPLAKKFSVVAGVLSAIPAGVLLCILWFFCGAALASITPGHGGGVGAFFTLSIVGIIGAIIGALVLGRRGQAGWAVFVLITVFLGIAPVTLCFGAVIHL